MVNKEEYKQYVDNLLSEEVNNDNLRLLESNYKKKSVSFVIAGPVFVFLSVVISFSTFEFVGPRMFLVGVLMFLAGVLLLVSGIIMSSKNSKAVKYYNDKYREKIIGYLFRGYDYEFDRFGQISANVFCASQFCGLYDRYCGFDKISVNIPSDDGGMTGVYLNMCDLNVIKIEKDDEGNKIEKCVYAGAFGYVEFPFEFKCILSINTKYKKRNVKMEKVALEDLTFHKKFGVYSSDQVEARYMLTPVAMEKLMILQKKVGTVMMTFVDNRMYIGFPDENLFELGKFDGNISSIFDDLYDDVYNLLVLVNEIKSNNKIFKI